MTQHPEGTEHSNEGRHISFQPIADLTFISVFAIFRIIMHCEPKLLIMPEAELHGEDQIRRLIDTITLEFAFRLPW